MHHSSSIKLSPFGTRNWLFSEIKRTFGGTYGSQMAVPDTDIFFKFVNLVKKQIVNFTGVAAVLTPTYGSTRLTLSLLGGEPYGIYWGLGGNPPVLILISMYLLSILKILWRMIGSLILNRLKSILMLLIDTDVIEIWKWSVEYHKLPLLITFEDLNAIVPQALIV